MSDDPVNFRIKVTKNGPYRVSGQPHTRLRRMVAGSDGNPVSYQDGAEMQMPAAAYLCRCGHSAKKPFCDGSHARVGFDGTETAGGEVYGDMARTFEGPELSFTDAKPLCARARFCDVKGTVWEQYAQTDDPTVAADFVQEIQMCPSGRLRAVRNADRAVLEPALAPGIGILKDEGKACSGPLQIEGGIVVESADGEVYEHRNRMTLCRCGASKNKPFCDGSHIGIDFQDGL
ncbi:iron-binding protein [Paracoccus limosus]|uniref:Iron-binding protein n=1 Tax=Paracoccus limosus TaxID=913252 RepID=A0A844HA32_9RHOB|nr:CDGSH iron-sulfur domain-containing protein [Paracoccus limosus]MTH36673.1 iron-binding protein [Paracoccus limosus]